MQIEIGALKYFDDLRKFCCHNSCDGEKKFLVRGQKEGVLIAPQIWSAYDILYI